MKIIKIIGQILVVPSAFALPLVLLSGAILHFFTAIVAYRLAGPGLWGYVATGVAFTFPIIAEIVVFACAWIATGAVINTYSTWLLLWLACAGALFGLMALGAWLLSLAEE